MFWCVKYYCFTIVYDFPWIIPACCVYPLVRNVNAYYFISWCLYNQQWCLFIFTSNLKEIPIPPIAISAIQNWSKRLYPWIFDWYFIQHFIQIIQNYFWQFLYFTQWSFYSFCRCTHWPVFTWWFLKLFFIFIWYFKVIWSSI